jgi:hypothetical protein
MVRSIQHIYQRRQKTAHPFFGYSDPCQDMPIEDRKLQALKCTEFIKGDKHTN